MLTANAILDFLVQVQWSAFAAYATHQALEAFDRWAYRRITGDGR